MRMDKCLVLLCTYCGEKYLREQLDSLLAQECVEIHIKCADDCSTDGTISILQEYKRRYPDVFDYYINEKNKRFTYNFIDLLFSTRDSEFDYYAFCDQDDVWLPNKISVAISKIRNTKSRSKGVLYCSNLTVVDEHLKKIEMQENIKMIRRTTRQSILVENIATGCTVVIDKAFHNQALKYYPHQIELHDYWLFLIAAFTAQVVYDPDAYILYRQHGANQIGTNKRKWTLSNMKKFFALRGKQGTMMRELISGYGDDIPQEDLQRMVLIRDYQYKFGVRMKLLFSSKIRKRNNNLILKLKIMTGKL